MVPSRNDSTHAAVEAAAGKPATEAALTCGAWAAAWRGDASAAFEVLCAAMHDASERLAQSGNVRRTDTADLAQTASMRLWASQARSLLAADRNVPLSAWCRGAGGRQSHQLPQ